MIAYDASTGKPLDLLVVHEYESTSRLAFILWPVAREGSGPMWGLGDESKSTRVQVQYARSGETIEHPAGYGFAFPPIGLSFVSEGGCNTSITRPGYRYAGYVPAGCRPGEMEIDRLLPARWDVGLIPVTRFVDETLPHLDRNDPLARMVAATATADLELAVKNKSFEASEQARAEQSLKKLRDALAEFKCAPAELNWPLPSAGDVAKACDLLASPKGVPVPRQVQAVVTLWRSGDGRSRTTLLKCLASEDDSVRAVAAIALGGLKENRARQPLIERQDKIGEPAKEALRMLGEPTSRATP
jgi:hypothetical protein